MERRDFLRMGGAVGVGAAATGGAACVPGLFGGKRVSDKEMSELFAQMDDGLARVSRYDMIDDFARRSGRSDTAPRCGTKDERALCRASLRTLYASSMFRSLPEEAQLHPAMQQRVFGQLREMDEAVFGMTDYMSSLPLERRDAIRKELKRDPAMPERISQGIDLGAGKLKLASARRFQMRSIFQQTGWRMRNHSTAVVIDECVTKVSKVTAQLGSQTALQRRIAAQIGDDAYWRYQDHLAMSFAQDPAGTGAGAPTVGSPPPVMALPRSGPLQPRVPEAANLTRNAHMAALNGFCETVAHLGRRVRELDPDYYTAAFVADPVIAGCVPRAVDPVVATIPPGPTRTTGQKVLGTGGWMMGIGLVTGLGGVALVSLDSDGPVVIGLIGLTVGAVLLVSGFVVVLIGALISATE